MHIPSGNGIPSGQGAESSAGTAKREIRGVYQSEAVCT